MGNIKITWDLRGPGKRIGAILRLFANSPSATVKEHMCVRPLPDLGMLQLIALNTAI